MSGHDHDHHDHHHHHDHDHSELSETELRVRALESILTEKGYVDPASLDLLIDLYEKKIGPRNGIRVVAKAWSRSGLSRAADDRTRPAAIAELDYSRPPGRAHGGGREHARPAQHGRVHAVLLLSASGARAAAGLVQIRALSLPRRLRSARRAAGFWRRPARDDQRSASGIPPPKSATSCCRCGPKAPRAGARNSSPNSSPATA